MGRSNNTTPDLGDSMTIVAGKWSERVVEGTEGAVSRALSKGKNKGSLVWERQWQALENLTLISAKFAKPEGFSEEQVDITCTDFKTGETFLLSLPCDSKYLKTLIMCLPILDTSLPFNLELHMARGKSPTGDDKYNLRVVQQGRSLHTHHFQEWKKDAQGQNICLHHNGCPAPERRGEKWDFYEQNIFLRAYFVEYLGSYVPPTAPCPVADEPVNQSAPPTAGTPTLADNPPPPTDKDVPADFDEYEDDIPF